MTTVHPRQKAFRYDGRADVWAVVLEKACNWKMGGEMMSRRRCTTARYDVRIDSIQHNAAGYAGW